MSDQIRDSNSRYSSEVLTERLSGRMSVEQIARRLDIGRLAVYSMLEQGILPGIRLGRRWIIARRIPELGEQLRPPCGLDLAANHAVN